MKAATTAVINLLATGSFVIADLYTITLASGTVLRYTSADLDIVWSGNTWSSQGPRIAREKTHVKPGLDVDELHLTLYPQASDQIAGQGWLAAARAGALDGAIFELDLALAPSWPQPPAPNLTMTPTGTVIWFLGRVAEVDLGRSSAALKVNSHLELLTAPFPRNVYLASCRHTLFDAGCTLAASSFATSSTAQAGSTKSTIIRPAGGPAANWFALGRVVMTGGQNAGFVRPVLSDDGANLALMYPLPFTVAAGDGFTAYPGCDKTQGTCTTKFSNLANFGGFSYVPVPETAV